MCPIHRTIVCVGVVVLCLVQGLGAQQESSTSDPFGIEPVVKPRRAPRPGKRLQAAPKILQANVAGAQPLKGVPIDGVTRTRSRIYDSLGKQIEFDFVETPLSDVVDYVRAGAGIPVVMDKRAFEENGIEIDEPITISLFGVTLRSALRLVLRDLDLTYVVRSEVLEITTHEKAEQTLLTRLYAVPDLAHREQPTILVTKTGSEFQLLKEILMVCIEPESWDEVGGMGSFTPYDPWGFVAISQTEEVHEQIAALLSTITRARRAEPGKSDETLTFPIMGEVELKAQVAIEKALASEVEVEFLDTPLSDVVDYFGDLCGIPILIDQRALDDVGMAADTPVTMSLGGVSFRSALRLLQREMDLTYVIANEVLNITTPEVAEGQLAISVYPVSDFRDPDGATRRGQASGLDLLTRLFTSSLAPDSWDEVGGPASIMTVDPWGLLFVSQTHEVHRQIRGLIAAARHVRKPVSKPPKTNRSADPFGGAQLGDDPFGGDPFGGDPLAGRSSKVDSSMQLRPYQVNQYSPKELSQLIMGVVEPMSWKKPHGGSIFTLGNRLIIRQTPEIHEEIGELLRAASANSNWQQFGGPNAFSGGQGGFGGGGFGGGGMGGGMGGGFN